MKVYNAYRAAVTTKGMPTVILARTIKGYGLGEAGEGKNITHQQKKMNEADLRSFRDRFGVPIPDDRIADAPFYRPDDKSPEIAYMKERREALGGFVPEARRRGAGDPVRRCRTCSRSSSQGTAGRKASTTMVFVKMLAKLLRDKEIGKLVVPIVPDEARTFGMESLFRAVGIYSSIGQLYEPVDMDTLLYYKEAKDGQILEEGITEAGSISSWIAAGTAYATQGVNTIPFFIFYSMFGFQRVGDFIWAAADSRCRGFLLGGTAGRTTLAGEGLQHQDGNSHTLALSVPTCRAVRSRRMRTSWRRSSGRHQADVRRWGAVLLLHHRHERAVRRCRRCPKGAEEGIIKGLYKFSDAAADDGAPAEVEGEGRGRSCIGSGAILNEVVKAQELLAKYGVAADVWSATSYNELYRDAHRVERWNLLAPDRADEACRT